MQVSLRRLGTTALALALAACAKQQPLPVASVGDVNTLTVATGQQIILDAGKSDAKGLGALTYQWSLQQMPRGSRARIEAPQNQVTRFTADVPTSVAEKYVVQLVVKSQYLVSEAQTLTIDALECGVNLPAINNLAATPASGAVDVPVQLAATVDDKDNDAACQPQLGNKKQVLRYAWSLFDQPAGSKAKIRDPAAVQASFTPDVAGTYTALLVVTDSTGRSSAPTRVDVQVQPCGAAFPVVNTTASSPISPNLAQPTQLTAQVTDADNDVRCKLNQKIALHWEAISLPTGSHATLNNPSANNPSFTPDVPGEYDFRVIATDDTGRSSAASAPLRIITKTCGGNPPLPVVQLIPAQASLGQPVALQVSADDDDEACGVHETYSYRWSLLSVPGGSSAQIAAPTAFNASFIPDAPGDYAIGMTITDSSGTTASSVTHLAVALCGNNPPSIDNLLGVTTGNKVHVTAAVHDADSACFGPAYDSSQTYRWTLTGKPAGSGAALLDPVAKAADFTADLPGTYQVQLVVTDASGLASAPALFTTQTNPCGAAPPQILSVGATNLAPDPGASIQLFAQTSDPDNGGACNLGQAVSLQWSIAARPAKSSAVVSDPAASQPSFTADAPGSYQFMVVAVDSTGLRSTPGFLTVTATSCGTGIPSVTVRPGLAAAAPLQAVNLSAVPFDSDTSCGLGDSFSYAWRVVSAPAGSSPLISNPAGASPVFTANLAGAYLVSATVSDARGHVSLPAFATVTIASCGVLPPLTGPVLSSAASLGTLVTLSAPSATAQACGASASLTYAWELTSRPVSSSAFLDNALGPTPHFTPDVAGAYQARLIVRDSLGLESVAGYANLNVAPCIASNLQWPAAAPFLSPAFVEPDGSAGTAAYVGTRVIMRTNESDPPGACGSAAVLPMQYQWALVSRPAGSAAALDSAAAKTPTFVPDVPGDYQLAARVSDALGGALPTRFATVSVAACGQSVPQVSIAAPASSALSTLQALVLQVAGGTATDADGYPGAPGGITCPARFAVTGFEYAWTVTPSSGAAATPAAGLATTFQASAPGTYTVQLVATASNGRKSAPATQVLTVSACGSHAPYIAGVSATVGGVASSRPLVNDLVTVTATADDDDIGAACGDSISAVAWTLAGSPPGSGVVAPAPGAAFTFQPDVAGRYLFSVSATDSRGLVSAPYTVSIDTAVCAPVLGAPTLSAGPYALGQPVTLTAALPSDACVKTPSFTYAWQIDAAPPGSAAALSSGSGATVSIRPDLRGAYTVQVVATDQAGFSSGPALAVVQVGASSCSLAPTLGAIASSVALPDAGDLTVLSAALTDNNGVACAPFTAPYRWRWSLLSRPAGSTASVLSSDASPTFVPDLPGSYQLAAQVTDALGNVSPLVSRILSTSSCGSNLPTASISGPAQAPTGTAAVFTGTTGDADNACPARFRVAVTSQWSVLTAPPGATAALSSTTGATTTLNADRAGSYVIGLVATASNGLKSPTATAAITLSDCGATPPQILSVSASVSRPPVGSGVTLTANAVDPDNVLGGSCGAAPLAQAISFKWRVVSAPAGASVDASAAVTQTFAFVAQAAGTYVFDVTAIDSAGLSSTPFRIAVPTGGCAPGLASASVSNPAPAIGSSVTLSALPAVIPDTCVSGTNTISYFWSLTSRPLSSSAAIANPAAASPAFTADVPGTYQFQVTVTDSAGFSASATVTLTAGGCGAGPTVVLRPYDSYEPGGVKVTPTVNRDATVALSATVSGGGCGASAVSYSYAWSILSRPAGSSAALDLPSGAAPTFVADVPNGTWQVRLVVRDQLGNASTPVYGAITASDCGARRPAPSILPNPVNNAIVFAPVALTASAADPEATCPARFAAAPLTFAWSVSSRPLEGAAPGFSASGAAATLTPNFPGTYQVQVVATGKDGIASAPVLATVTTGGCGYNAPTISSITGAQTLPAAAASPFNARRDIVFTGVTDDLDNDAACLAAGTPHQGQLQRWTVTASPPGSVAQMQGADTLAPRLFPDLPGNYTVVLQASDDKGLAGTRSFTFAVSGACGNAAPAVVDNQPPGTPAFTATQTLTASNILTTTSLVPRQLALGFPVVLGAPNVVDADTGCGFPASFTYAWQLTGPAGSQAPLGGAATATPSFVPDVTGLYKLSLLVSDTTGLSGAATFTIDVECGAAGPVAVDDVANSKPAFSATQSVTGLRISGFATPQARTLTRSTLATTPVAFYPGVPVQLQANVADSDSVCTFPEVIGYAWEIASAPAGSIAALNNAAARSPSFTPDLAGEYDFRLTLTDSTGRSSTQVFSTAFSAAIVGVSSCGAQAPSAAIALDAPLAIPAPAAAQVLYTASTPVFDASASSTPDATPLNEATGAGCGLSPTLSYQWSLTEQPFFSGTALTGTQNVTASLVSHTDGLYLVQLVVSDGKHLSAPANLQVRSATPSKFVSSFTATPTSGITANGVQTSALTVTVEDAAGRLIGGVPVTFAVANSSATSPADLADTLVQSAAVTPVSGTVTATLASTLADSKRVTASIGGLALPRQVIGFVPGPAALLAFQSQPQTTQQNLPMLLPVTVRVQDAFANNILATQDGANDTAVTLTLDNLNNVGNAKLEQGSCVAGKCTFTACTASKPCTATTAGGLASFANLSVTKLGTFALFADGTYTPLSTGTPFNFPQKTSVNFDVIPPPKPAAAPSAVTATASVAAGADQVLITASGADPNLSGYNVYRTDSLGNNPTLLANVSVAGPGSTLSYTDSAVVDATTYFYEVTQVNQTGEGPFSTPPVSATTAPATPANVAVAAGNGQVRLTWTASPTSTAYAVYRATTNNFSPLPTPVSVPVTACDVGGNCSYIDSSVLNGTSYYYEVGALNGGGEHDSASVGPVFPVPAPDLAHTSFALSGASTNPPIADNSNARGAQLIVSVADAAGNALRNEPVTLSGSRPADPFTVASGLTNASGTLASTLKSLVAETKTLTAVIGPYNGQLTLTLQVTFVGGAAVSLAFVAPPGNVQAGQVIPIAVAARDLNGNPTGAPGNVTVSLTASVVALSGTKTRALNLGTANFNDLSIATPGAYSFTALSGALNAVSGNFTVSASTASVYSSLGASDHACTVRSNHTLWCWGKNGRGQLGDGSTTDRAAPVQESTLATNWQQVATGGDFPDPFTCAVKTDQSLWCWGGNLYGQLTFAPDSGAHPNPAASAATGFTSVTAGGAHACGIASGSLFCWGDNRQNQLALASQPTVNQIATTFSGTQSDTAPSDYYGQTFTPSVTAPITEATFGIVQTGGCDGNVVVSLDLYPAVGGVPDTAGAPLASATRNMCALAIQGGGNNNSGPFVFGATPVLTAGTQYVLLAHISATPAGGFGFVNVLVDTAGSYPGGTAIHSTTFGAWAFSAETSFDSPFSVTLTYPAAQATAPQKVGLANTWTSVSAGLQHTCGLQGNALSCWGDNLSGETGTGSAGGTVQTPAAVAGSWNSVSSGRAFTCAISSGSLYCWGDNAAGQLGIGNTTQQNSPAHIGALTDWTQVSAGATHACAVHTAGAISCWGDNSAGELGLGSLTSFSSPQTVPGGKTWSAIAAGQRFTCALDTAGAAFCWGDNTSGQGGTGVPGTVSAPLRVDARDWTALAAGATHTCALRSDGTLWCTGSNATGALGDGTTANRLVMTQETTHSTWKSLGAGASALSTCAVRSDGALLCWGDNSNAELGLGAVSTPVPTPTQVGSALNWTQVSSSGNHTCAVAADGTASCFGLNAAGQIGNGLTGGNVLSPASIGASAPPSPWTQIAAGADNSCAVTQSGQLDCWGGNASGQSQAAGGPVPVNEGGSGWTAVSLGNSFGCGLRGTSLSCWGNQNGVGDLGNGVPAGASTVPITLAGGYASVAVGQQHACAIGAGGALSCWGDNGNGQIGSGSAGAAQLTPAVIGADTNWKTLALGSQHSCGLHTDGSLWCWGANASGQLGDGGPNLLSPVAVQDPNQLPTGTPAAATSTIAVSRALVPADGVTQTFISVVAKTAAGVAIANQPVTLTVDGVGNVLTAAAAVTDGAGVVTATLTSTAAGVKTVTAAVGPINLNATVTFQAGAPDPGVTTFAIAPSYLPADGTAQAAIAVHAADVNGNPVARQLVQLGSTGGAVFANFGYTDGSGNYAAAATSTTPDTETISATVDTVTLTKSVTFFGPATQIFFNTQPQNATSGSTIGAVQVTLQDLNGNPVTNSTAAVVASLTTPNGAQLLGTTTANAAAGVANFGGLVVNKAGTYTLTMTSPGATGTSASFTITNPWTPTGPLGATINVALIHPLTPATVFVGTDVGVFKSVDNGAHWTAATTGMGRAVVFALRLTSNTNGTSTTPLWAGCDTGIYKSTDNGTTWTLVRAGVTTALGTGPSNLGRLYALNAGKLLMSGDTGATFADVTHSLNVSGGGLIAVDDTDTTIAYFAPVTGGDVFQTTNAGGAWASTSFGSTVARSLTMKNQVLYAGAQAAVSIWDNTAQNPAWSTPANTNLAGSVRALAVDSAGKLYAGTDAGALFVSSSPLAQTWAAASANLLPGKQVTALSAHPATASKLVVGQKDVGVSVYTNATTSILSNTGITTFDATTAGFASDGTAYVYSVGAGMQRSTDGGLTWLDIGTSSLTGVTQVNGFAFDGAGNVFAATNAEPFKLASGATTWTSLALAKGATFSLAVDPLVANQLWAGTASQGVWKLTGGTWTQAPTAGLPGTPTQVTGLLVHPSTGAVYAQLQDALYTLASGGTTWAKPLVQPTGTGLVWDPSTSHVYAAFNGAGVFAEMAAGVWSSVNSPAFPASPPAVGLAVETVASAGSPAGTLYAILQPGGVYRSSNQGATWTQANNGLTDTASLQGLAKSTTTSGLLVVVSTSAGSARTTSGGL